MEGRGGVFEELECQGVAKNVEEKEEGLFLHLNRLRVGDGFKQVENVFDGGVLIGRFGRFLFDHFGD